MRAVLQADDGRHPRPGHGEDQWRRHLAVRLRDGAGVEAVPYGQRGHADAHVRSASGIITGNCDIDGAATVYDDNYISGHR